MPLAKLKQNNYDYDEYQSEFIRLSHHVYGLLEEFLASCFLSELRDPVKFKRMIKRMPMVEVAKKWAKLEEEKLAAIRRGPRPPMASLLVVTNLLDQAADGSGS